MTGWTEEQFEQLVREHHQAVYRSALRIVADTAAAADVAQEVFARAAAGKVRLAQATSERATLCWLAARLGQNAVRARRRRQHHEHHPEHAMNPPRSNQDPAAAAENNDMTAIVQQCVAELPRDLQLPLELHYQDELTLSAVGSALRLSTSTVYDRVQRALAQLRQALHGRGLAIAPVALPQLLREVPVPAVPAGLEAQLLVLAKASTLVAIDGTRRLAIAVFAAVCAASVAVGAILLVDAVAVHAVTPATATLTNAFTRAGGARHAIVDAEAGDRTHRMAAVVALPDLHDGGPVPELPPQDPQPKKRKALGTVHDSAHWPVVNAKVSVIAAGGYKPFELGSGTTNHLGAFEFQFGRNMGVTVVRFSVRENGVQLLLTDEILLASKDLTCPFELKLPVQAGVATERYECGVSVEDDAGAALAGVKVTVYPAPLAMPGMVRGTREALGQTDERGAVQLRGRKLGSKWLFVDGRHLGYGYSFTKVDLATAGQHDKTFQLSKAGSLHVQCQSVAGKPISWPRVWLFDEQMGLYLHGKEDPKGGVRFTGLQQRRYSLQVNGGTDYSPGRLASVAASEEPVMVTLKSRTDTRDVGNHMGEVHGTVVDAESGDELPLSSFAIEILRVRPCQSTLPFDGLVPPAPVQRMAGRFKQTGFHEVGLQPGRYAVVVKERGYASAMHEFEITDRDMHVGLRIPLHRGATVTGRLLDAVGAPIKGASVFPIGVGVGADERLASWSRSRDQGDRVTGASNYPPCSVLSDANGVFVLEGVPAGMALRVVARWRRKVAVAQLGTVQNGAKVELPPLQLSR